MDKAIRSAKLTAAGILDKARARTAVTRAGGQIAPSKYLPDVPRQVHADGGRTNANGGGTMDLRSKAAEIVRSQPQAKGSVDQLLAMVGKTKGVKQAELLNAGRPAGNSVSKEELAQHFEDAVPKIQVQRSESTTGGLSEAEKQRMQHLESIGPHNLNANELSEWAQLATREDNKDQAKYQQHTLPEGENYREHLLTIPNAIEEKNKIKQQELAILHEKAVKSGDRDLMRKLAAEYNDLNAGGVDTNFHSMHWDTPNVLAHLRMKDRDNGKTLHVEEVQSDWGQQGREQGLYDPEKPFEVVRKGTNEVVSRHSDWSSMWDAYRLHPESDQLNYGDVRSEKVPQAPYVGNTQHWTDLAVKHALTEAAKGGHDRVVFSPGEANADLYGQRTPVSRIDLHVPVGMTDALGNLYTRDKASDASFDPIHIKDEKELINQLGRKHAKALLSQEPTTFGGESSRAISEPDMHLGGHGMVDYYNNIVHPSALKLLQQHDPSIKPESYDLPNGYKGFALPMTDKARQSILGNGFQAFKDGGTVDDDGGGEVDSVLGNNQNGDLNVGTQSETGTAPLNPAPRAQAGELRDAGGIRGGAGILPAPHEAPLEGLLTPVKIPMTGQVIHAGPNPRIRQVARDYMASMGLPYNPPKKYARVDPSRSERISDAYDAMKDNSSDPLTKASYDAMIKETMAQYRAAKAAGFKAEFWDPNTQEDPYYASPRLATEDIRNNHHMFVYPTNAGYGSEGPITPEQIKKNPMLQPSGETWNGVPVTVNDIFRAVHDYFGHAKEGVGFRDDGEENAWRAHASMFSPLARMAMTTETRGQNSWLNYGPFGEKNRKARTEGSTFAPQKVGILPHWVHHEGAEDFMGPEDINAMAAIRKVHGKAGGGTVDAAIALTRRFSKDGTGATLALKSKGK